MSAPVSATAGKERAKKTGRPAHPLWMHFHRGEKRNRYHYHAFCVYCVARLGLPQVAPTRGVSTDMLRHLEGCAYCPREIVAEVKDICERREAAHHSDQHKAPTPAHRKKHAAAVEAAGADQARFGLPGDGVATNGAGASAMEQALQQSIDAASNSVTTDQTAGQHTADKRKNADIMASSVGLADTFMAPPRKKHATASQTAGFGLTGEEGVANAGQTGKEVSTSVVNQDATRGGDDWVASVLKVVVSANLPLSVLQRPDFLALLMCANPATLDGDGLVFDDAHITNAVRKLASVQLDRVKEGMLNSTIIKGGLTLSINCWSTLDLQHLVAFSLLNSNGDAACVRVVDMGNHVNAYTSPKLALAIEGVLDELGRAQHITVMGIVADSVVALNAARRVCRAPKWASLLVVPCISAVLSTMAGSVFTHEGFKEAIGELVEIASHFSNPALHSALRDVSGVRDAYIPLPRRDSWFSLMECLGAVLEYADVITAICVGTTRTLGNEEISQPSVPASLAELVVGGDGAFWKTLRDMERVLAPLREAYCVVTPQQVEQESDKTSNQEGSSSSEQVFRYAPGTVLVQSGLTLAQVMHQFGRMSQQYTALVQNAGRSSSNSSSLHPVALSVARLLVGLVDTLWKRYDLPAMALAYVFDFHLDASVLNFSNPLLEWKSLALYFQRYFRRWFTCDSTTSPPTIAINISASSAPSSPGLLPERLNEILGAYQLRQFPFDPATTGDYTDVSSFYSFVSDSHPEICALCCRLYALGLASANVRGIIRGIGVVPPIAQTTDCPATVELMLHIGFASSFKKRVPRATDRKNGEVSGSLIDGDPSSCTPEELLLCSSDEWTSFSEEWRRYLNHELAMDEFEQLNQIASGVEGASGSESVSSAPQDDTGEESMRQLKLGLEQTFVSKLPPLPHATFLADVDEDDGSGSSQHPSSVLL